MFHTNVKLGNINFTLVAERRLTDNVIPEQCIEHLGGVVVKMKIIHVMELIEVVEGLIGTVLIVFQNRRQSIPVLK